MDKLKALAAKCGIKPELANRFFEAMERHLSQEKARLLGEHKQRQEEAKRVCLEEVETYKQEIARRLQIFCEAKGAQIESSVARQTAIKESAATTKLRNILSLLEGVEPNGEHNGALQAENVKLKKKLQQAVAESRKAIETANRQSSIAARVLTNNRRLEAQLQESRRGGGGAITEGQQRRQPSQRLDGTRMRRPSGQPITTRATLQENQERSRRPQPAPAADPGEFSPDSIASTMEPDLV